MRIFLPVNIALILRNRPKQIYLNKNFLIQSYCTCQLILYCALYPFSFFGCPPQCLAVGRACAHAIAAVGAVVTLWAALAAWVQIKRASLLTGSLALAGAFTGLPINAQPRRTLG